MDPRFLLEHGTGIFTGNELIVKGALESQVGAITGYPGSPLAELFETLENNKDLFNERGIVAQIANNEALAAARLNGSQMQGIRAMAVMKNVGLHVAADGLALGNMAGASPTGGALVVVGDDTWSEGTQVPADSRFLSQHLYMPVLEPATFQEIKDWIGQGFELSRRSRLYLTYLVTSNQADGGGSVEVYPNRFPALNRRQRITIDPSAIASDDRVIIPPVTARKEREVIHQRYPKLWQLVREMGINQILYPTDFAPQPLGFITSGLAYSYLEHALQILGLSGRFPILKLGITYPVDPEILKRFAQQAQIFCIVEERRPFIEPQVATELARHKDLGIDLWGKRFPGGEPGFADVQGLHPSLIIQTLARLFAALDADLPVNDLKLQTELDLLAPVPAAAAVPPRTPSFCPGCPHRDSATVLKKMAADFAAPPAGQDPVELVFHGDIGCYSMLKYAPFSELMHNLSGMGLGGGTGAGIDPFIDNKQLVFMGDSTFFHTGMTAISDSIKNGQDITYIILDNKTTAMTGHQPTPGADIDVLGQSTFAQDIEKIVRGLAGDSGTFIARMNPAERQDYTDLVRDTLLRDGVKIIIADKECGITYHRRQRAQHSKVVKERGFRPVEKHINI
ncbi:MAG: thiamine pyrophosphate-dependent enzyme, partial [Candidatus Latescibacterota bacterium]|nr:thiamine pyrophosphate-dependent enzyme [Candidatus Latescibacterota bacterium]